MKDGEAPSSIALEGASLLTFDALGLNFLVKRRQFRGPQAGARVVVHVWETFG